MGGTRDGKPGNYVCIHGGPADLGSSAPYTAALAAVEPWVRQLVLAANGRVEVSD